MGDIIIKTSFFEKIIAREIKKNPNKTPIELCINDEKDLYSRFSILNGENNSGNGKINNEIIEYLKNEAAHVPVKNPVAVNIRIPDTADIKIDCITELIKSNVEERIVSINKKFTKANRKSIILALIGMFLIAFTQVFQFLARRYSINEFVIVMSWVFMWKAVELFYFERVETMKEKRVLIKLYYAEIAVERVTLR